MSINPILIPLVAIIGGISFAAFMRWLSYKEKTADHGESQSEMHAELDALKERVAALETIVTDGRENLRKQIDDL